MNQKARHNSKHKYLDKISVGNQCEPCWSSSLEIISQDNSKEENFFLSSPFFPSESDRNSFSTSSSKIAGKYQFETKKSYLESGSFVVPHPAKAYKGGEDAHFISENVIGVADGVGGWADSGVDPALYANKLMEGSLNAVHANCLDPVKILNYAYEYSKDIVGSSTACIIVVDEYKLRAANLGDSGFMVIRNGEVFFRSKEQQHSFNFPYQLGTGSTSLPEHSHFVEFEIKNGDIIVAGSDGLFDNVFDEEIVELVRNELSHEDPCIPLLAQEIALNASKLAHMTNRVSPFAQGAAQAGLYFVGGKIDDITVIVSKVVLQENSQEKAN